MVPWRRTRLLREVRDHLLEAVDQERQRGLTVSDAEDEAIARFGTTRQLVRGELREAGFLWVWLTGAAQALRVFPTTQPLMPEVAADELPNRFHLHERQFRSRVINVLDAERELLGAVNMIPVGSRSLLLDGLLDPTPCWSVASWHPNTGCVRWAQPSGV